MKTLPLANFPAELLPKHPEPRFPPPASKRTTIASATIDYRWAQGVLASACHNIAHRTEPGRNNLLNEESHNLGMLIPRYLDRATVESQLTEAARQSGLFEDPGCGASGVRDTIASGLTAGMRKPRTRPERQKMPPPPPMPPPSTNTATLPPPASSEPLILDPKNPLVTAQTFRSLQFSHPDCSTLLHDGDTFTDWRGAAYEDAEGPWMRSTVYAFLAKAQKYIQDKSTKEFKLIDFKPTKHDVDLVIDALKADAHSRSKPPCWLVSDADLPAPADLLATQNGIIHLIPGGDPRTLRRPTPIYFTRNALDYNFDPNAPAPARLLKFLDQLWPDDPQSIELLQEWAGYCLTPDTRQQKMLLLVGPPRSGKGTIARVLTQLVGAHNVCGPTLSSLTTNFGLAPLLNKTLAIVSDARLSGRADQAVIVERLLAITGEDGITIDRKNREAVTAKLSTRFMILTNELPRLGDASGATANRFVALVLNQDFLGKEDTTLTAQLLAELPSILLWAIEGWQRLRCRGHFIQPNSSDEAIQELKDLGSPIRAFVEAQCAVEPGAHCDPRDLFESWDLWCRQQGREHPGTLHVFGRDLRAAFPRIGMSQPRVEDGGRKRMYTGIRLQDTPVADLAIYRASKEAKERWQRGER